MRKSLLFADISKKDRIVNSSNKNHKLKVAAYCKVSKAPEGQINSFQYLNLIYRGHITSNPDWSFVGVFVDEGKDARAQFDKMIRMCKEKKIDLILCKSVTRFAPNTTECIEYVKLLKRLGIGVIFEKETLNTLSEYGESILTMCCSLYKTE